MAERSLPAGRPGYQANLTTAWLPALDGVVDKLTRGAKVADVGCGHGASSIVMAKAYPNSRFVGIDFHAPSVDTARKRAADAGTGHGEEELLFHYIERPRSGKDGCVACPALLRACFRITGLRG